MAGYSARFAWAVFVAMVAAGCLFGSGSATAWAQVTEDVAAPSSESTIRELVFIQRGNIPLIISAPHGGRTAIPGVPERQDATSYRFATVRDENTMELASALASQLEMKLQARPWLVIAKFERKYLDVNRESSSAYESELARASYDTYHGALAEACREVQNRWQGGLLLDIHGQAKHPNSLLRGTRNLQTVPVLLNRYGLEAIEGPNSLFGHLTTLGYQVEPKAGTGNRETQNYTGGYIVATYGSHMPGGVDAIQLEFGRKYRAGNDTVEQTAADLAEAIVVHCEHYLPAALTNRPAESQPRPKTRASR